MRQAAGVFRNAAIVGETRNCFYVRERRPAQRQPFGLEDAGLASRRLGVGMSCNMSGSIKSMHQNEKGRPVSRLPLEPFSTPPVHQDPADLTMVHRLFGRAPSSGRTEMNVRPLALA